MVGDLVDTLANSEKHWKICIKSRKPWKVTKRAGDYFDGNGYNVKHANKKTFIFGAGFPRFDHLPCGVESSLGPDEHRGEYCRAYEMQRIVSHDLLSHQQHQGSVGHDCDSPACGYFLFHEVYSYLRE